MKRRFRAAVICSVAVVLVSGCSWFPGFDGPFAIGTGPQHIPIDEIKNQIQCELRQFILQSYPKFESSRIGLDEKKSATISLNLQLDSTGSLTYLGVDLSVFSLDKVIAIANNRPGVFARAGGKSVVSTQVDIAIPQVVSYVPQVTSTVETSSTRNQRNTLSPNALAVPVDALTCGSQIHSSLLRLDIDKWLDAFFYEHAQEKRENVGPHCISKITFKSSFQVLFQVGAALNPYGTTKLLAPVNQFSLDLSPAHTHSLSLVLNLKDRKNPELCKA